MSSHPRIPITSLRIPKAFMYEHYYLISGRRSQLPSQVRALMARQHLEARVFMSSYDGFLDLANKFP